MKLELVGFPICPFVQRSLITLLYKNVSHKLTHIQPGNPPDWFAAISPTGKVPLLRVDDSTVLFESAVINEFIDETSADPLMPVDPILRAQNRAWIEFGSSCIMNLYAVSTAQEEGHKSALESFRSNLDRLEEQLGAGPYFNGAGFSLVDTSFAPLFIRLNLLLKVHPLITAANWPKVAAWNQALVDIPAVADSIHPKFEQMYRGFLKSKKGFLSAKL